MTPTVYLALARDAVIVLALAAVLYLVYRAGEDRVRAKDIQGLQDQMKRQGDVLTGWRKESIDANAKLAEDMAKINAAAAVPIKHTWVCKQPAGGEPAVLPGTPSQAGGGDSTGGSVQRGRGEATDGSWRDAIVAAYKQRWETTLAGCRAEDSQWPH